MGFTLEMKESLKKTYKSIKKGINSFLKKLGFNKKDAAEFTDKLLKDGGKEIAKRQAMTKKQAQIHNQVKAQSPEVNQEVFRNFMDVMNELHEKTQEKTEEQSYDR
ncbi:hypothetical protein [Spiroplasma citri]|uniref:Uncharacterized protein n=1 Tax=Spiroplasma citri TaxID=2133 RepID=A0AAJ4EJN8_SPICI|nr:hypothetical protein [Spiroplasma citri]APE74980.1 hypothetical protein SCITRI_001095 [Spiroplasma citri]QED24917.1 hypothetical protein FRX96_05805 [Spiroplasma citri]QIA67226.1 hypothetical protein GMI18_06025 [Spiroplasma citri]QIA69137.1 hypothetical protein GL298_06280 [Spiroplasma citri]QIA71003.1 hypothetical protein GL981_06335 [Spiroplasma citri]